MSDSWTDIKSKYGIDAQQKKSQDKLSTLDRLNNEPERDIYEEIRTTVSDIMRDTSMASAQSDSIAEWLSNMWVVLTVGRRGVIVGTILIVISLAVLATMPPRPLIE